MNDLMALILILSFYLSIFLIVRYLDHHEEKKRLANRTPEEILQYELQAKQEAIEAEEARLLREDKVSRRVKAEKIKAQQEADQETLRVAELKKLNAKADAVMAELGIS